MDKNINVVHPSFHGCGARRGWTWLELAPSVSTPTIGSIQPVMARKLMLYKHQSNLKRYKMSAMFHWFTVWCEQQLLTLFLAHVLWIYEYIGSIPMPFTDGGLLRSVFNIHLFFMTSVLCVYRPNAGEFEEGLMSPVRSQSSCAL